MVIERFPRVHGLATRRTRVRKRVGKVDGLDVVERVMLGLVVEGVADAALVAPARHLHTQGCGAGAYVYTISS